MSKLIKEYVPDRIVNLLGEIRVRLILLKRYYLDLKRFHLSAALHSHNISVDHLRARITYHYHALEKGLSNPNMRLGFGKRAMDGLFEALEQYTARGYSTADLRYRTGISTIKQYIALHDLEGYDVSDVKDRLRGYLFEDEDLGGIEIRSRIDSSDRNKEICFSTLAKNRVSVREFSDKSVNTNLINDAIEISMKTPSVCNRQPWKTYVIKNEETKIEVLRHQKGFKGYEAGVDTLILVTSNLSSFLSVNERNQGFVDGGMFCMSLLYSLEYLGLAACALNGALPTNSDEQVRSILGIPNNEVIVMFIAVGHFPERYKVPKSKRDCYKDITRYIV